MRNWKEKERCFDKLSTNGKWDDPDLTLAALAGRREPHHPLDAIIEDRFPDISTSSIAARDERAAC